MIRRIFGIFNESKEADLLLGRTLKRCGIIETVPAYRDQIAKTGLGGPPSRFHVLKDVYVLTEYRLGRHPDRPEALLSLEAKDLIAGLVWSRYVPREAPDGLAQLILLSSFGSPLVLPHAGDGLPYERTWEKLQEEGFIRSKGDSLYLQRSIDDYLREK